MDIIALILAGLSLVVIVFILAKKFPVLANIDIKEIQAERQAELKRKILNDKFKRQMMKFGQTFFKFLAPVGKSLGRFGKFIYDKLVNLKDNYSHENEVGQEDAAKKIALLFAEAEELNHKADPARAEAKYIEIIGLDSKNFKAFALLGENYLNRDSYEEAEQTFKHAIKLQEQLKKSGHDLNDLDLAKTFFNLSLVYIKMNSWPAAFLELKQALALEDSNPRYLDKMTELCIIMKDSVQAKTFCQKLESTNPGNKKLKDFKDRIRELENRLDSQGADNNKLADVESANDSQQEETEINN
jgi:tetratricopeptide (TPR) repeat protein